MKRILIAVFAAVLLCGIMLAQDATPPASSATPSDQQTPSATPSPQQAPQQTPQQPPAAGQPATPHAPANGTAGQASATHKVAAGSVIPVQLTKTVDAKKAKTGDEVVAKVTQDLKTAGGEIVVPKDTKVVGHVTEAQARSKDQKESQVGIAFDRAVMKDGGEMQLPMSIQAVIGEPSNPGNSSGGGGYEQPGATRSSTGGGAMGGGASSGGRQGGMSGGGSAPPPSATPGSVPSDNQAGANPQEPITGNTRGVVGISNLKLEAGANATQGSVLSSEKNNVKLESGTFMLLRVNQ
jgi:hypothetical protein